MSRFVNLSNHPNAGWSPAQRAAALALADAILDAPFPEVPPLSDTLAVERQAQDLIDALPPDTVVALVMGEFTLTVALVARLQAAGVRCVAACARRDVTILDDGRKAVRFEFQQLRDYPTIA